MKILFICTHNRCRSILCEAISNHLAHGAITAYSAGSAPAGEVHPLTLHYLQQRGIPTEKLKSESWDAYETVSPDIVITVCDSAAKEACPVWFGDCAKVHWGLPDPSKLNAGNAEIQTAFFAVMDTIEARIKKILSLNLNDLDKSNSQKTLTAIAEEIK